MILWTVKLISSVRRAIAGRKYPHQLAWAVAFGLLLGIVPHGNLLAIGLLIVVLSLRINHAMAGLTAVGATFLATRLDPYSHQVGEYILTHPELTDTASAAWQLPLMPWTDLNNTVVLGSFLIGVAALVPVFMITYPVFRMLAPRDSNDSGENGEATGRPNDVRHLDDATHQVVVVDQGHPQVASPHRSPPQRIPETAPHASAATDTEGEVDFAEVASDGENHVAVETRIDVIRMTDHRGSEGESHSSSDESNQQQPMDEALNYLLRQLRDSQQRKAA